MVEQNASTDAGEESDNQLSRAEQLLARTLDQLAVVMLTRDRIHETLEEAVERISRGDFGVEVAPGGADEIRALAEAFR